MENEDLSGRNDVNNTKENSGKIHTDEHYAKLTISENKIYLNGEQLIGVIDYILEKPRGKTAELSILLMVRT